MNTNASGLNSIQIIIRKKKIKVYLAINIPTIHKDMLKSVTIISE